MHDHFYSYTDFDFILDEVKKQIIPSWHREWLTTIAVFIQFERGRTLLLKLFFQGHGFVAVDKLCVY